MKKTKGIICIFLFAAILLVGCGKSGKTENIDAAMTAIEELDYESALESLEQALVSGENVRQIYRGQGIAYLGLTRYTDAIEAFEKCLSISSAIPDGMDYDLNYYLAVAYYKAGRLEDAKGVYDAILNMKEKEPDAHYMRGTILLELGNYDLAKADFDRAIELEPNHYDQLISIYQALDACGYQEVGNEYLQRALTQAPKDISNYNKGRIYFYLEDFDSARNYLEQGRDAGDAQAAYYLGKTWEALGEYNYAASVYNSYIKEQGESALIYNQLAMCQMQLGDYEAALSAIQAGLAMEDESLMQTLSFNQIVILEHQGEFKQAAALTKSYLRSYPDDEVAAREYEFLVSR